ncbi:hypothetical protein CHR53_18955 [Neobacillus mesonae]|uniref:Uncharacterized protein n=1 Tax=Neobacillus mesonae TaxID=1193713 RepID=A0A3T0I1D7_9BACI|nr:hypothetical protein CHR53_18955 [Neobacillus mesonae]
MICSLLIGAEGTRLLRDREVTGDPTGAKRRRRLQDFPAESECPERKSTGPVSMVNLIIKSVF